MTSTSSTKRLTPFDFAKSINEKSENLLAVQPEAEKDYQPFLVNRALSFSSDTVLHANLMNQCPNLDKKLQYDFLFASVRRRKRYDKWIKKGDTDDLILLVSKVYQVNLRRAAEYLSMMTDDQKEAIRKGHGGT
jgi:hypothetical protein